MTSPIAIVLTRRSHLKVLSPVIEAAWRRYGWDKVAVVWDPQAAKKGDKLNWREWWDFNARWPWQKVVKRVPEGTQAIVGVDGAVKAPWWARTVLVDPLFDCWLKPPHRGQVYASAFHRDTHIALWGPGKTPGPVVGWLPSDQVLNEGDLCGRYHKDTAVFFTLKLDVPEPWRQSREGHREYRKVYEQARELAHDQGLAFIVKSRAKNKDPRWVQQGADEYHLDECMVPYTSLTLLARAKWCVHFESGAAIEAALMGAYGCVIRVPQTHVERLPGGEHIYWRDGRDVPPSLHCWPGVTQYGLGGELHFSPSAREAYLTHFIGQHDGRVAERVLDVAEGK